MRTVHEPEHLRAATNDSTPPSKGKSNGRLKQAHGASSALNKPPSTPAAAPDLLAPTHDEDGNEVVPSPANDNITYVPAHHPITGQPGFMIHYPPDIQFTAYESAIPANELMNVLRRQLHWAQKEQEEMKREVERMEYDKREEWNLKEILLEGVMEAELARAEEEGLLRDVEQSVVEAMEKDVEPSAHVVWKGGSKPTRSRNPLHHLRNQGGEDTAMPDGESRDVARAEEEEPDEGQRMPEPSSSPPPTGKSGGFDGENDPYDNYLAGRMAEYEERERQRNTPLKARGAQRTEDALTRREREVAEAETDAVGALMGMSAVGAIAR